VSGCCNDLVSNECHRASHFNVSATITVTCELGHRNRIRLVLSISYGIGSWNLFLFSAADKKGAGPK